MPYVSGGGVIIKNPLALPITVNLTPVTGSVTVYNDAARTSSQTVPVSSVATTDVALYVIPNGLYTLSLKVAGQEVAGANGSTIVVDLRNDNRYIRAAGQTADLAAKDRANAHGGFTTVSTVATTTGTVDLSLATAHVHARTLTGNTTFTFSGAVSGVACELILFATQDGTGSRTITWPASVKWPAATAPTISTAAGRTDQFRFVTIDGGTTWRGVANVYMG